MKNKFITIIKVAFAASTFAFSLPSYSATVVEFYNTKLDNYFITADASEAAMIDNGSAGAGWIRTGNTFESGGSDPVCRFYGSQSPGPNSHFYTVDAGECNDLKQIQANTPSSEKRWNFESLDFTSTPLGSNGTCVTGTMPVYRAYNNGSARGIDSNHRITTSLAAIREVVAEGWTNEGAVMCAPSMASMGAKYQAAEKFDQALVGTNMIDVMGLSNFTPTQTIQFAYPAKIGSSVNAESIIQSLGLVFSNARYSIDPPRFGNSSVYGQLAMPPIIEYLLLDGVAIYSKPYTEVVGQRKPVSYLTTVTGTELNRMNFGIGSTLNSFISMIIDYGTGVAQENMPNILGRWLHDFYTDTTPHTATAKEIVEAAYAFGDKYSGVSSGFSIGCEEIVNQISYAAGAGMVPDWGSSRYFKPSDTGRWKIVFNSIEAGQDPNWTARLMPGDIVNTIGGSGALGGHMFVVTAVNGHDVETVDNGVDSEISRNVKSSLDSRNLDGVVIYRLDTKYSATNIRILNWFASQFSGLLANAITQEANGYTIRLYSNGYAVGVKNNHLFVFNPVTNTTVELSENDYLSVAYND